MTQPFSSFEPDEESRQTEAALRRVLCPAGSTERAWQRLQESLRTAGDHPSPRLGPRRPSAARRWLFRSAVAAVAAVITAIVVYYHAIPHVRIGPADGDVDTVVHAPAPAVDNTLGEFEVSKIIISQDSESCCVTDLTGDVPLCYCFSKEPYAPVYFARLPPEP